MANINKKNNERIFNQITQLVVGLTKQIETFKTWKYDYKKMYFVSCKSGIYICYSRTKYCYDKIDVDIELPIEGHKESFPDFCDKFSIEYHPILGEKSYYYKEDCGVANIKGSTQDTEDLPDEEFEKISTVLSQLISELEYLMPSFRIYDTDNLTPSARVNSEQHIFTKISEKLGVADKSLYPTVWLTSTFWGLVIMSILNKEYFDSFDSDNKIIARMMDFEKCFANNVSANLLAGNPVFLEFWHVMQKYGEDSSSFNHTIITMSLAEAGLSPEDIDIPVVGSDTQDWNIKDRYNKLRQLYTQTSSQYTSFFETRLIIEILQGLSPIIIRTLEYIAYKDIIAARKKMDNDETIDIFDEIHWLITNWFSKTGARLKELLSNNEVLYIENSITPNFELSSEWYKEFKDGKHIYFSEYTWQEFLKHITTQPTSNDPSDYIKITPNSVTINGETYYNDDTCFTFEETTRKSQQKGRKRAQPNKLKQEIE